jgi:hypothetical protein
MKIITAGAQLLASHSAADRMRGATLAHKNNFAVGREFAVGRAVKGEKRPREEAPGAGQDRKGQGRPRCRYCKKHLPKGTTFVEHDARCPKKPS